MISETNAVDLWQEKRQEDGSINLASQVDLKKGKRANDFVLAIYNTFYDERKGSEFQINFSFRIYDSMTILHFDFAIVSIFAGREKVKSFLFVRRIVRNERLEKYVLQNIESMKEVIKKKQSPIYEALSKDAILLAKMLRDFPELQNYL